MSSEFITPKPSFGIQVVPVASSPPLAIPAASNIHQRGVGALFGTSVSYSSLPSSSPVIPESVQTIPIRNEPQQQQQQQKNEGILINIEEEVEQDGEEDEEYKHQKNDTSKVAVRDSLQSTGSGIEVEVSQPISSSQAKAIRNQTWLKATEKYWPHITYISKEIPRMNASSITMTFGLFWVMLLTIAFFVALLQAKNIDETFMYYFVLVTSIITLLVCLIMFFGYIYYYDKYKNISHEQGVWLILPLIVLFCAYVMAFAGLGFVLTQNSCVRTNPNERVIILNADDDSSSSSETSDDESSETSKEDSEDRHNKHRAKKCMHNLKNLDKIVKLPIGKVRGVQVMAVGELVSAYTQFIVAGLMFLAFYINSISYHYYPQASCNTAEFKKKVTMDVFKVKGPNGQEETVLRKRTNKQKHR